MKKIGILLLCLSTSICVLWAQTPENVTSAFIDKIETNALQANFSIIITERATEPISYNGNIQMLGSKFHLQMDGLEVCFDGKTQWAYMVDSEEINITEPTADELSETNPVVLIKALRNTCTIRFSDTEKDTAAYIVDFYPQNKMSNVLKLTLKIRKTDLVPLNITMKETQGKTTTLKFSNQKMGIPTNAHTFSLDGKKYPNAIINDLR